MEAMAQSKYLPINSRVKVHSYVKLPEGNFVWFRVALFYDSSMETIWNLQAQTLVKGAVDLGFHPTFGYFMALPAEICFASPKFGWSNHVQVTMSHLRMHSTIIYPL